MAALAGRLGCRGLAIATVTGDDVLDAVRGGHYTIAETGEPVTSLGDRLVSANAYIGAEPIVEALGQGADIVITGRAADPSLFVAPLVHEFGWSLDDWPRLGRGTLAGHLLECAAQVTGGYFADPGRKDVERLEDVGFPIAEVSDEGPIVITKLEASGGAVTTATCKEQLLYEIHDPTTYMTPDVVADFSRVRMRAAGKDRVEVQGATGRVRPDLLKVSLGYRDGFIGEGQLSYAGTGAAARAALAGRIVVERLARKGIRGDDVRCDLVGVSALHPGHVGAPRPEPYEVRVRVAARAASLAIAQDIGNEVEALYTNGPAGGGGAVKSAREVLSVGSTFVPRSLVRCTVHRQVV